MSEEAHEGHDRLRYWRTAAFVLSGALLVFIVLSVTGNISKNSTAIEKGCILLQNTLIKATQPQPSSKVLLKSIVNHMTPAERAAYAEKKKEDNPRALFVDCKKLANDPGKIKAVPAPGGPSAKDKP